MIRLIQLEISSQKYKVSNIITDTSGYMLTTAILLERRENPDSLLMIIDIESYHADSIRRDVGPRSYAIHYCIVTNHCIYNNSNVK